MSNVAEQLFCCIEKLNTLGEGLGYDFDYEQGTDLVLAVRDELWALYKLLEKERMKTDEQENSAG